MQIVVDAVVNEIFARYDYGTGFNDTPHIAITDVNAQYLKQRRLTVEKLGRGYAWLDTGTPSSLLRAAQFVETVEDRQGLQIGSPEEVAWRKGYIDDAGLARLIEPSRESEYGKYLQRLLARG